MEGFRELCVFFRHQMCNKQINRKRQVSWKQASRSLGKQAGKGPLGSAGHSICLICSGKRNPDASGRGAHIAMHTLVILSETSLLVCGGNTSRSTGHPCWVIPFLRFEGLVRSFEKHRTSLGLSPHFPLSPESVFFLVLFSRFPNPCLCQSG